MKDRFGNNGYAVKDNYQLDADTRENQFQHLAEHGPASLLASNKLSQYAGCFTEEITRAIAVE